MVVLKAHDFQVLLSLLRLDGGSDGGIQWTTCSLEVQELDQHFSTSGSWLTLDEWFNVRDLLLMPEHKSHRVDCIEPNISLELRSDSSLKITLDLEAIPIWRKDSISFIFELPYKMRLEQGHRLDERLSRLTKLPKAEKI